MRWQRAMIGLLALMIGVVIGCSKKEAERHRISGTVKYDNESIPYGEVLFTPDGANAGPQGIAKIRDGKYDTAMTEGKGYAGGRTTIRVTGFTQPGGKGLICEYEYSVDLPNGTTTHDINVPAEGGVKKGKDDI